MNAPIENYLNPRGDVSVRFSVAARDDDIQVRATVSFNASGYQQLGPGGAVSVNGQALAVTPLAKQGYWYTGDIPAAAAYQLSYVLGPGVGAVQRTMASREFRPALPSEISKGNALVFAFAGSLLRSNERIFAELTGGGDGPGRWGVTLKATVNQNIITIAMQSLAQARLGEAKLYVGVLTRDASPSGDFSSVQAMGVERAVRVVD